MEQSTKKLTILHFNDVYNLEEKKQEPVGGAARFKTALDSFNESEPLILFSGDLFQPSNLSTAYNGEQMIMPMNEFGVAVACFGNHEFDTDIELLTHYISQMKFPWLLSNVKSREEWKPVAGGLETFVLEKQGLRIGFMGLAEGDWVHDSSYLSGENMEFEEFVDCAKRLNKELRENQKCDMVIALTHLRNNNDFILAKAVPELDLILGGHDHLNLIENVNGTYVIKSGSDFVEFNKIELTLLSEEDIKNLSEDGKNQVYKGKYLIEIKTVNVTKEFEPNQNIKDHLHKYHSEYEERMKLPVLHCNVELETRFAKVRGSETNFANFIADVLRFNTECDMTLLNTGTFRSDYLFPSGILTLSDMKFILPWEDLIMKLRLTGKQVWEALENSVSTYPTLDGRFLAISGVKFAFDPKKEPGKRIPLSSIRVNDSELDLEWQYTIATKLYMANGKDGYAVLLNSERLIDEGTAEDIHTILKKLYALGKDPAIREEWNQGNNGVVLDDIPSLQKSKSLEKKMSFIKRRDFFTKVKSIIKGFVSNQEGETLVSIAPEIEGRIRVIGS